MASEWGFRRRALLVVGGSTTASALLAALLLVLPKFVDISTFGYVQLYLFYVTYLSYASLGISDGLFIRFSGTPLSDIPAEVVSGHFRFLALVLACTVPIALLVVNTLSSGPQVLVLSVAVLSTSAYLLRSLLTFLYQAAGDAKLFARSTVLERALWVGLAMALLADGYRGLALFLWADLAARLAGLALCTRTAWPILSARMPWRASLHEIGLSLRVGLFVSVAAIATVLVPAIGRLAAERGFGIAVFAELSLAFSLQSIVLSVIGPVGLVVLPSIKRRRQDALPAMYSSARSLISPLLLIGVLLFFPLVLATQYWLPTFRLLPTFLSFVFPMIVFESRTRMLAIPLMQALSMERVLMAVNLGCLVVASALSYVTVWVLNSVSGLAISLLLIVALRGLTLEKIIENRLETTTWRSTTLELGTIATFLLAINRPLVEGWWVLALFTWSLYLTINRRPLLSILRSRTI